MVNTSANWMHQVFRAELEAQGKAFAVLSGSHSARLLKAISLIDPLIERCGLDN